MFEFFKRLFHRKKHIHTFGYVAGEKERETFRAVFDTITFHTL